MPAWNEPVKAAARVVSPSFGTVPSGAGRDAGVVSDAPAIEIEVAWTFSAFPSPSLRMGSAVVRVLDAMRLALGLPATRLTVVLWQPLVLRSRTSIDTHTDSVGYDGCLGLMGVVSKHFLHTAIACWATAFACIDL